jgi:20S proteasome alpha/beta subunit
MTLIAGFLGRDGLLMCADMEEGDGVSKRKIVKLWFRTFGDTAVVLAGSGSAAVIDNAVERIDKALVARLGVSDEDALQDLVDETLRTVHEKYVWPNPRTDHSIQLMVGYSHEGKPRLWITQDTVTKPETRFACAGSGQDLANYLADRLYHPSYSEQQMVLVAAVIFREVKRNVAGVGQGTMMWMLPNSGAPRVYHFNELEVLEAGLPSFEVMFLGYRQDLTGPLYPHLPFTVDVPYREICTMEDGYFRGRSIPSAREIRRLTFK